MTTAALVSQGRGSRAGPRQYPSYTATGLAWIQELPSHWKVRRLKDVVRMNPDVLGENTDPELLIRYVDIGNVDSTGQVLDHQDIAFGQAPSRARRRVRSGDTIISTVRTYLRAIAYVDGSTANLVVSTGFAVLRPGKDLDDRFLWRLVQTPEFVDAVVSHSEGIGYPAISPTQLAALSVWVPPVDEQRLIAAFLDRETAKIDALIAKKQRLIELLQEKRTALISHAVTKGLDPEVPMKESGIDSLDQIPQDWELVSVRRFATAVEQGWSPVAEDRQAEDEEWAVIKLSAIHKGHFRSWEHKALPKDLIPERRYEIKDGDFLITRSNTPDLVGDVCVVDSARSRLMLCDLVYRVQVDAERIDKRFLSYSMLSRFGRHQITAEARGSITPARKFRMLLHTNPTRERGECLGTRAGASEDM
jgi:type I restriction enzyme, S subunit